MYRQRLFAIVRIYCWHLEGFADVLYHEVVSFILYRVWNCGFSIFSLFTGSSIISPRNPRVALIYRWTRCYTKGRWHYWFYELYWLWWPDFHSFHALGYSRLWGCFYPGSKSFARRRYSLINRLMSLQDPVLLRQSRSLQYGGSYNLLGLWCRYIYHCRSVL